MTPAQKLAQAQLDAYNNRDIDAFAACYAPEVEVYMQGGERQYKGIETLRENYRTYFANNPNLHAKLLNRMVQGNFAIDHEYVTGRSNGQDVYAIAIYEVTNDLIQKVWFI